MKTQTIDYQDNNTTLEGYYAYDDKIPGKQPAILICHDWSGKNDFVKRKAEKLAALGYVGFALDMYGKGKIGTTKEEKAALMQPLMQNRAMLLQRIQAAYQTVQGLEVVDTTKIAAIGFCFGGLCALDLARSGIDIRGVISFHGLFLAPNLGPQKAIKAKILALHGYDDPMVNHDSLIGFANEMTAAKADWQLDIYGNTMHAFTNPEANDPGFGTVYNKAADSRSSTAMQAFLSEIFAP